MPWWHCDKKQIDWGAWVVSPTTNKYTQPRTTASSTSANAKGVFYGIRDLSSPPLSKTKIIIQASSAHSTPTNAIRRPRVGYPRLHHQTRVTSIIWPSAIQKYQTYHSATPRVIVPAKQAKADKDLCPSFPTDTTSHA